jgi:hypothetical protein
MSQPGGPAAINGFLYQIIHHLGWLANVTLGKLDGQEIKDACLVLEPRSGGDARAEASGTYLVEQYKTRESGTWSILDLQLVLCDLRKAVPSSRPNNARYRFVTDGRAGRLETFFAFLADLKSAAGPDELDNTNKRKFGDNLTVTNQEFLDHIIATTRSGTPQSTDQERAVVFHLLCHFEMEFGASGSARTAAVERLLRRYAPDLGDESKIREQLVGVLVERLSKGETRLDTVAVNDLFRHVGLNPERLRSLAELAETMSALIHRRFARLKYQPDRDVRGAPEWPPGKPVLLIAGESGTGKTWQLGRLLEACTQERQIATFVSAATTREDLLAQASRDVWQSGLGETSDKSLVGVSHFLRELAPDASNPRLIVTLDDVQDIDLARDLVRQDWMDWGMRLALTVPRAVARSLAMTDGDAIHVHSVDDFSVDELDAVLKQKGRRWADLPSDLKKLLRSPILAGLFLELPYFSFQTAPRSEYEIFERFWERIAAKCRTGDEGIVIALAAHMREGKPYPLPRPMWQEIGLTDEGALSRLEAAGWLRSTEIGEIAFAHDRLLNWAIAKSLVWQFQSKHLSLDGLATFLGGETGEQAWYVSQRLGYVPMDTLWSLAADETNTELLGQLVTRLEACHQFGSYGEDLYVQLLPTLGQRAVPVLLERLNAMSIGSDDDYRVGLIGKAFANLARQENVDLEKAIDYLLKAPSRNHQRVAIAALTAAPDARHLDRLWELHQQRVDALEDQTDGSRFSDYHASFAALRAGVAVAPGWLRECILAADAEKDRVSELGYLLNGLEHPDAPAIWQMARDTLMAKVSPNKPRSLLYCIARFSDHEKLDFVIEHLLRREDFASAAALAALTVLDPLAAINRLVEVEDFDRYATRNHWLPALLRAHPQLARQRILDLAKADPKGRRIIESLFWERPDEMDEPMLSFMLRALEKELHDRLDETVAGDPNWLYHPLDFLGRIAHSELLAILQNEAGRDLERMIVAVACSCLHTNSNYRNDIRENARRVLILIGGEGITTLIKRELESEHYWVRHGGLRWAFIRSDDGIIDRLAAIARRPVPRDAIGKTESYPYLEFHQAITALAAIGPDSVLVDTLWEAGMPELPINLSQLRDYRGPLPKALTDQARRTLESDAPTENSLLIALVIAELSADTAFIPLVLSVLGRADPESRVARFACIAARQLGDRSYEFARLALGVAQTKENAAWGLNALATLGTRGLEFLGNWLQSRKASTHPDHDVSVIRTLYDDPTTRKLGIDAAVDRCLRGGFLFDAPYDIAAEADIPALREQIHDKAFAARSFVVTAPLHAIKGLAKFDAMRAVEAIALGLQSHQKIERQLCQLLVRITPKTAGEKLIEAASSIERQSLRRAVGRGLRRLDPEIVSRLLIERMTGSASERKTATELAGWIPFPSITEALSHLAAHDSVTEVRYAALAALDLHRRENNIRALFAAFPSATPARRWSLLVTILEVADPYLLTDAEDPLWLGRILSDDVPAVFEHYANSVLSQRKQKGD